MDIALVFTILSLVLNTGIVSWALWSIRKIAREEADLRVEPLLKRFDEHELDRHAHSEAFELQIAKVLHRIDLIADKLDNVVGKMDTLIGEHKALTKKGYCPISALSNATINDDSL